MPKAKRRSDFHYEADDGSKWDSRFEYLVYKGALDAGLRLRRCEKGRDTIPYTHIIPRASCADCGSARVGSARGATFDLFVTGDPSRQEDDYYLEPKGYMRAPKRALYRSLFKEKSPRVRFIIQSNYKVGKTSFGGWISKHLKCPWFLWKGTYPTESQWNMPEEKHEPRPRKKAVRKVS